jgi:hypothetical protein
MRRIVIMKKRLVAFTSVPLSLLALTSAAALAQAPVGKPAEPRRKAPIVAYDPLAESRRTTAVALINSLADEARSFHDEMLRARVQARAADALWETEPDRARLLFRRAWDAAEQADQDLARRAEEERRRQRERGGPMIFSGQPNLRGEVLKLAARRERALGDEFLKKLEGERKQGADAPASPAVAAPSEFASAMRQRVTLARQLLQDGETERAMQFAAPALQTTTRDSILFLTDLREKSADQADKIYASLLACAAADPASDANTVSLLFSYVFTPRTFITVNRAGNYGIEMGGRPNAATDFPTALRAALLQSASQILLRPPAAPDQDRSSSGRAGTYFMIARLLPFFEQYLPASAAALRAQMTGLTTDVPGDFRNQVERLAKEGIKRDDQEQRDDVQDALDRLARATTDEARDRAYVDAAMAADGRRDARAREFAESVKDSSTRDQLLAFVDFSAASAAIEKKDVDAILGVVRRGAMSHLQQVWALTEAARLAAKDNRPLALEILDEAAQAVRRIDEADPDRARALLAVATPLYELDSARVWAQMADLVKTVNAVPEFTGEDGSLVIKFQTKSHASIRSSGADNFNLQPLFQLLARADLDRAVELAKTFTGESPRAVAMLAVATSVLNEPAKSKAKS